MRRWTASWALLRSFMRHVTWGGGHQVHTHVFFCLQWSSAVVAWPEAQLAGLRRLAHHTRVSSCFLRLAHTFAKPMQGTCLVQSTPVRPCLMMWTRSLELGAPASAALAFLCGEAHLHQLLKYSCVDRHTCISCSSILVWRGLCFRPHSKA